MYMALSRFAKGIKIDDLCTMSTQHTNCNLIGALYCVLINDMYPAKRYNYMFQQSTIVHSTKDTRTN